MFGVVVDGDRFDFVPALVDPFGDVPLGYVAGYRDAHLLAVLDEVLSGVFVGSCGGFFLGLLLVLEEVTSGLL